MNDGTEPTPPATKPQPSPGKFSLTLVVLFPLFVASAIFLIITMFNGNPAWGPAAICAAQVGMLVLAWKYVQGNPSWPLVLVILFIVVGIYLLSAGMCVGNPNMF